MQEAPAKQIDEAISVTSAPEKAAPPPAPTAKGAPPAAAAPVTAPSTSAPAAAAVPARAAAYAPSSASENGASPLVARITINEKTEATVALMTETEAAESVATGAEAEAEESRPPSQHGDEMSAAEIAEAEALADEFSKDARARKEQYEATTKVRHTHATILAFPSAASLASGPAFNTASYPYQVQAVIRGKAARASGRKAAEETPAAEADPAVAEPAPTATPAPAEEAAPPEEATPPTAEAVPLAGESVVEEAAEAAVEGDSPPVETAVEMAEDGESVRVSLSVDTPRA